MPVTRKESKMIAPSAMIIEIATDQLKSPATFAGHTWVPAAQRKELHSALPDASEDFTTGFELGIQTARVLLLGNRQADL
jgi:hypothetical protein